MNGRSLCVLRSADAALGTLFLYSAITKGWNPQIAELGIDRLLNRHGVGKWAVLAVILLECTVGVTLDLRGGLAPRLFTLFMLVGFSAYLAALKWGAPGTACGCAGSTGVPGTVEFVRNTLLVFGAAALVVASAHRADQSKGNQP